MAIDVHMLGRLARDPEQKATPSGQNYVTFPFAVWLPMRKVPIIKGAKKPLQFLTTAL